VPGIHQRPGLQDLGAAHFMAHISTLGAGAAALIQINSNTMDVEPRPG
jgi:hypothetical protein